jgi:Uma2 family endonuclease
MSIATTSPMPATLGRPDVFVVADIVIPGWVVDLASFRRWALADASEPHRLASYLAGTIYVDPSMEKLLTHNQVKGAFAISIANLLGLNPPGMFVHDRMLLTNTAADLSTEPDGLFFYWETARSGRLTMIEGADDIVELVGTPDMVLEVVSKGSVTKDVKTLRELYWKAEIPEYWLVDARSETARFEILRYAASGYEAVESDDGWVASGIFERRFRIVRDTNPLGKPRFVVEVS